MLQLTFNRGEFCPALLPLAATFPPSRTEQWCAIKSQVIRDSNVLIYQPIERLRRSKGSIRPVHPCFQNVDMLSRADVIPEGVLA